MKRDKHKFLKLFFIFVAVMAVVRLAVNAIGWGHLGGYDHAKATPATPIVADEAMLSSQQDEAAAPPPQPVSSPFFNSDGTERHNRILSVPHFGNAFPDQNDVQLASAQKLGVQPVADRAQAEHMKDRLVYIGASPYYYVDNLRSSIPYLVPRASVLLHDIGRTFFDSLQVKQVPLHKLIVTSVLRTKADVAKLRTHNSNATENSAHMYGTTFDVCYNRYKTVQTAADKRRTVRDDTLKWVLSEVLDDMRRQGRCYVKYEVKQGCFHITTR